MKLVLFEPEIPQNAGTLIRMCTCFNIDVAIIEPASFLFSNKLFKRAGMDYIDLSKIEHYNSFDEMRSLYDHARIILLDTKSTIDYYKERYKSDDIIMVGRESSGVPDYVYNQCDVAVRIPMTAGVRSLNVAISAAIVVSEALRQQEYSVILEKLNSYSLG